MLILVKRNFMTKQTLEEIAHLCADSMDEEKTILSPQNQSVINSPPRESIVQNHTASPTGTLAMFVSLLFICSFDTLFCFFSPSFSQLK
jgi:hypothetical protein